MQQAQKLVIIARVVAEISWSTDRHTHTHAHTHGRTHHNTLHIGLFFSFKIYGSNVSSLSNVSIAFGSRAPPDILRELTEHVPPKLLTR